MSHITLQWDWFYFQDTVVILWVGSGLRASLRSLLWFVQCYVTLSVHAQTSVWGNRRNEARIHGHLCQESAGFMDFTLINVRALWIYFCLSKDPSYWSLCVYPSYTRIRGFQLCELDWGVWVVGLVLVCGFVLVFFFLTFIGVFKSKEEFCTFSSATPLQVKNVTACESAARANNNLTDMSWHWNAY